MATVTYTATDPTTGETFTRSSGTMFYSHAVIGCGVTWHTSEALAVKASTSGQHRSTLGHFRRAAICQPLDAKPPRTARVVTVVPTAVNGRAAVGDFPHPHAAARAAIDDLIRAKTGAAPSNVNPISGRVRQGAAKITGKLGAPRPVGRTESGRFTAAAEIPAEVRELARRAAALDRAQVAELDPPRGIVLDPTDPVRPLRRRTIDTGTPVPTIPAAVTAHRPEDGHTTESACPQCLDHMAAMRAELERVRAELERERERNAAAADPALF